MNEKTLSSSHFNDKEVIEHVIEKRAEGIFSHTECHGVEIPGHISSAADAARESALALLLLGTISSFLFPEGNFFYLLLGFSFAWMVWKTGRSAWLAWSRLERLHRVIEQEKYEIEHHREQEREELTALYRAKGFEGKLLTDVIDVLMADGDRLLKVMLEEELGLTLGNHEHPIKQAFGAFLGCLAASVFILGGFLFSGFIGVLITSCFVIAIAAYLSAYTEKNRAIHAIVWNISIALLSFGTLYFLLQKLSI